jgi:broad specificity phosphatase PhoE
VLIIVRHGRTEANASGLLLGRRLDPDLDDTGRAHAAATARVLGRVDRVVTSPLLRTRSTAAAIDGPVEVDERWVELDYGALDGTPMRDVPADLWRRWRSDIGFAPDGGESIAALGERVRDACTELAAAAHDEDIVVVTHVSPLKAAVAWALGVEDTITWRMYAAPGSITRIAVSDRGPSLHCYNATGHLD